ncbi:ATP-binding protein [Candidatus Riflebacteria bacterium]
MSKDHEIPANREIIIVEDDPGLMALIKRSLENTGLKTTGFFNGTTAVNEIEKDQDALLLVDYLLPDMKASKLMAKLRAKSNFLQFIIMTGKGDEKVAVEMMKLGAFDYLVKDGKFLQILPTLVKRALEQIEIDHRLSRAEDALKESEERYRQMFEKNLAVKLLIESETGLIVEGNPAAVKFYGFSLDELRKKRIQDLDIRKPGLLKQESEIPRAEKQYYLQSQHRLASGEVRDVEVYSSSIFQSGQSLVYNIIHDITQRKEAERNLSKLNEELEKRVRDRTAELQKSLETIKRAQADLVESQKLAALGGMVAGMAHEINTPLGMGVTAASFLEWKTSQFIELYEKNDISKSDLEKYVKQACESSRIILTNLNRSAELIQSFKLVTVDQTRAELRCFNLKEYLKKVILSLKPQFKKTRHQISLICPETIKIICDPGALSQITTNLVINSLMHGFEDKDKGHIKIKVTKKKRAVLMQYRDDGKGIPPENKQKIFEPFFTTKRARGGTGLGLHIVYNLVNQRLGGRIKCESIINKGSVFKIEIPCETMV